ncbi:hypothetical protein F4859DRAFT_509987 [Xylaria cf. heliscus]|nr:hypothetical protein F4859DRAFT_509987 [Xylaria cf. heliscus]
MDDNSSGTITTANEGGPPLGRAIELCPGRNNILNVISKLHSSRLTQAVNAPSILVYRDRSSGRGTLLSAITGIPFPVNESLCSQLVIELALHRNEVPRISAEIIPGSCRSNEEREVLSAFRQRTHDLDISKTIKEAEEIIHLNTTGRLFYGDILYIEIEGPTQPNVVLVDLPGLFPAGSNGQFEQDDECVEATMIDYMGRKQVIILVVMAAEKDFALLQRVITLAKTPGLRVSWAMLGVIAQPDTLDVSSESEQFYTGRVQNYYDGILVGWHMLCHRPSSTATERDWPEGDFLFRGGRRGLDQSHDGVEALRTRVGNMLYYNVVEELLGII